jgi:hypothetical protein
MMQTPPQYYLERGQARLLQAALQVALRLRLLQAPL